MEMARTLEEVVRDAMELPYEEREILIHRLFGDMQSVDPEIEKSWGDEADRRLDELLNGTVKGIPAEEVFAEVRKALNEQRKISPSRPE